MSEQPARYVVTTRSSRGVSRTQLWSSELPLPIGHPFQWVMERTDKGLRIRALLSGQTEEQGKIFAADSQDIPIPLPSTGMELNLSAGKPEGKNVVSVRVRPAISMPALFEGLPAYNPGDSLHVYNCLGAWVMGSTEIGDRYSARFQGKPVFSITREAGAYRVQAQLEGVEHGRADGSKAATAPANPLPIKSPAQLSATELRDSFLRYQGRIWRFGSAREIIMPAPLPGAERLRDPEAQWFRRALGVVSLSLAIAVGIALVIPVPEEPEDVIPPQVAKLVFQHPAPATAANNPTPEATVAKAVADAPKKVQAAAVVQAFRAKALQNAMSGLLKGGMARLLAQSDFAAGSTATAQARKIFDSKSDVLQPTSPDIGFDVSKSAKVASLGGAGVSTAAASGTPGSVGYGKGDHAALKGQGETFVGLDIASASVEEGLSKDEVGSIIHKHLSEIRYCYESAMLRTPDIEGKLMMSFVIGGNGSVKTSEVKSSTLPDPRLDDCVLRRLVTWRFPTPKGGVEVAVTYPFIFKTLGR